LFIMVQRILERCILALIALSDRLVQRSITPFPNWYLKLPISLLPFHHRHLVRFKVTHFDHDRFSIRICL
jgi:hypothetical protein